MGIVIASGSDLGLQSTSLNPQGRNDVVGDVGLDDGSGLTVNVATGNLVYTQKDSYLPSRGQDFELIRTYNSYGDAGKSGDVLDSRWMLSTGITIKKEKADGEYYYQVSYGDGAVFNYYLDEASGNYMSSEGDGAFEVLRLIFEDKGKKKKYLEGYEVTRSDQSTLTFDKKGQLTRWTDANGVFMEFTYKSKKLVQVQDDTGHTVSYNYHKGKLASITSESATGETNTLVQYRYNKGRLSEVTDRYGHVTRYHYTKYGLLARIELPSNQKSNGQTDYFSERSITITYADQKNSGGKGGKNPLIASITNAEGQITHFDFTFLSTKKKDKDYYESKYYAGGTTTITDAKGYVLTYSYDKNGNVTEVVDQHGNATTYRYDAKDNLLSITDRRGNTSSYTYDNRGNLLTTTDNEGNRTTYTYTAFNKVASITNSNQQGLDEPKSQTFEYDVTSYNLLKQTSALGNITRFEYDEYGNLERQIAEMGFGPDGNIIEQVTTYFYDQFGNNIGTETIVGDDADPIKTAGEFDIFGNRTSFTDGNGNKTQFIYDNDNRLLQSIDALGRTTTYTYDAVGNVLTLTDAKLFQIVNVYDRNNNLLSTTELGDGTASRVVTRAYDFIGNLISIEDAEGRITSYSYNARRELITISTAGVINADGLSEGQYVTSLGYDAEGNKLMVIDPRGNLTTYEYTNNNQLEFETNANGQRIQYAYDANANLISVVAGVQLTDDFKRQSRFNEYDAENRVIAVIDAEGNRTAYTYDAVGNVSSVTDARGFTTRYDYDLANRLVREILPESGPDGQPYITSYRFDANANQIAVIDANNNVTEFIFDAANRKIAVVDANSIKTEYAYDANDNLTSLTIQDLERPSDLSRTTLSYNAFDQLIAETDALGNALVESDQLLYREVRQSMGYSSSVAGLDSVEKVAILNAYTAHYIYDKVDNLTRVIDNEGRSTSYQYDTLNRLIRETDALGGVKQYFYDGNGNLVRQRDELGRESHFSFDAVNQLTKQTNAKAVVSQFDYDDFGNLIRQVDAVGRDEVSVADFEYNRNNLLTASLDARGNRTSFKYDAVSNRTEITDARDHTTHFEYDTVSRLVVVRDPLGFENLITYDGVGNRIQLTDARGSSIKVTYDPGNRIVRTVDGEDRVTEYVLDARDNQISVTTGVGSNEAQTTIFAYDTANSLRSVTDATGGVTAYDFDRVYNQTAIIDANGNRKVVEFDALNRIVSSQDALGGSSHFQLDAVGNLLEFTDANGNLKTYQYNETNRIISEVDALGIETRYQYDANDLLLTVTRASGTAEAQQTVFEYDAYGNVIKEINALGDTKLFIYDENNNLKDKIDERGFKTSYVYDALNRVVGVEDPLAAVTTYIYDGNGNRTAVIDANGSSTLFYFNQANELSAEVNALGFLTSYSYDSNGNLVSETRYATAVSLVTDADGRPLAVAPQVEANAALDRRIQYRYDALNRVIAEIDALGNIRQFQYDAVGNEIVVTDQNWYQTAYEYDALNRQVVERDALGGEITAVFDKLGNEIMTRDQLGRVTYSQYDALNRLIKQSDPVANGEMLDTAYAEVFSDANTSTLFSYSEYDKSGNVIGLVDRAGFTRIYAYNALNQRISVVDAAGYQVTYTYDAAGNLLESIDPRQQNFPADEQKKTVYTYDALNRVTTVTDTEGRLRTVVYDALGNETAVTDALGITTKATYNALDQQLLSTVVDSDTLLEVSLEFEYNAFGEIVRRTDESGVVTTSSYDQLGRQQSKMVGAVVTTYLYDKAGNILSETRAGDRIARYEYDALNRAVKRLDPKDGERHITFDAVGNVRVLQEQNGNSEYKEFDANNRVTKLLTRDGFISHFAYDKMGNEISRSEYQLRYVVGPDETIPEPSLVDSPKVFSATYTALNQLETETDASGLVTEYEYDEAGNLLAVYEYVAGSVASNVGSVGAPSILAASNRSVRSEAKYNSANELIETTDANGTVTRFVLNKKGLLKQKTEAFGTDLARTTRYTYDGRGRLKTQTGPNELTETYQYDQAGRIEQQVTSGPNMLDRIALFEYDADGRLHAEIDPAGNRVEYNYDAAGNISATTYAQGTTYAFTKTYEYDLNDRLIAEVDGDGVRTEYIYDAVGNKTSTIQVVGDADLERTTVYTYDSQDRLTSVRDPLGKLTAYYYDQKGNQTVIERADGTVTFNTFDDMGRILTNTVGLALVASDNNGRATANFISEHGGVTTTNTYDVRGNVLTTTVGFTDGTGPQRLTTYGWDVLDQLTSVTNADGYTTQFTYDVFGNRTTILVGLYLVPVDDTGYEQEKADKARPQATIFRYNNADQLVETISGEGSVVRNSYDALGNQLSVTVGVKLLTSVTVDGVTINASDDIEHIATTLYSYDSSGRLLTKTTGGGVEVQITRDVLGRQISVRTLLTDNATLTTADDRWSEVVSEYDTQGRLVRETDAEQISTTYEYNGVGDLVESEVATGTSDARVTRYSYDLMANLETTTDAMGGITRYEYDDAGNVVQITDAEGGASYRYYNEYNQLVSEVSSIGALISYQRDAFGNAILVTQFANMATGASQDVTPSVQSSSNDRTIEQTFNANNKRLRETFANGSGSVFEFDSVGLLLKQTAKAATDAEMVSRTVDVSDRVLEWQWDSAGRVALFTNIDGSTEQYTYDSAGNKRSEAIVNPQLLANGQIDIARITQFEYDQDNRLIRQTSGTNTQIIRYDNAGNVIEREDGRGAVTYITYDLNNRLKTITNAAQQTTRYNYDSVGNLVQLIDGENNISDYQFDFNNRLIVEQGPLTTVFTVAQGQETIRPTATNTYDKLGRLVERVDAEGFTVTRWYDAVGQMTAEMDGDLVLRAYTYTAFGELDKTATAKQRASLRPGASAVTKPALAPSDAVVFTNFFDTAGNLIKTEFPAINVTLLTGTGVTTAQSSNQATAITDQSFFDAWGNLVESHDRNGAVSYAYYDSLGRTIAIVDSEGFLTETAYDNQGNVVQQRKFVDQLTSVSASVIPEPGVDAASVSVQRFYSAEGYLLKEVSAGVRTEAASGYEQVETTFRYDAAGNQVSRTSASNQLSQQQIEYYYFNAINQRIGVITADRVLSTFDYDANGNVIEQRRFADSVDSNVDLNASMPVDDRNVSSATLASFGVAPDSAVDQIRVFDYDAQKLLFRQTDVMSGETDRVTIFYYDANGNLTKKIVSDEIDSAGSVSRLVYDAAGRIILTIPPNGGYSFVEYNTLGLKTKAWIGGDPDASVPIAQAPAAQVSGGADGELRISWSFDADVDSNGLTTWLAWDTQPVTTIPAGQLPSAAPGGASGDLYANSTASGRDNTRSNIPLSQLATGESVYFRVMVKDSFGNISWSAEQSLVVPATIEQISIQPVGAEYLVEVTFSSTVSNPFIIVAGNETALNDQGGVWSTTLLIPDLDAAISFVATFNGERFETSGQPVLLAQSEGTQTIDGWIQLLIPQQGSTAIGNAQWVLVDGQQITTESYRSNGTLQVELPDGSYPKQYDILYGDSSEQSNTLSVTYRDGQTTVYTPTGYERDSDDNITSSLFAKRWVSDGDGFVDVDIAVLLSGEEVVRIGGDGQLHLATRQAGGGAFTDGGGLSKDGLQYSGSMVLEADSSYDLKIYYTDVNGNEVITQWVRVTTAGESSPSSQEEVSFSGFVPAPPVDMRVVALDTSTTIVEQSLTVRASETRGTVSSVDDILSVTAGAYAGPIDGEVFAASTSISASGATGNYNVGKLDTNLKPYYTIIEYNDLGYVTASNEGDGLWREFGLDAMGNRVETTLLGDDRNAASGIVTYAHFDGLGRTVQSIGPDVAAGKSVTYTTFDYDGRIIVIQDPGNEESQARTFAYDEVGNLIAERDALGYYTNHYYDLLGNLVKTVDAAGDTQIFVYAYTGHNAGRLTARYVEGIAATTTEYYDYDTFGRRTTVTKGTDPSSQSVTRVQYNQADQIIRLTDADNHVTHYWYDTRGNQTWVKDANGSFFGKRYNLMGQLTHEYTFTSKPADLQSAKNAVSGSTVVVRENVYDVFGNIIATISPAGARNNRTFGSFARVLSSGDVFYTYDDYGRRETETGGGRDITRSYDNANRLLDINDQTTQTTTNYTYDIAGNRATEQVHNAGALTRNLVYNYNARGQLNRWNDAVPGVYQAFDYYADGNISSVDSDGSVKTYIYDAANRVTNAGTVVYSYNELGLRQSEGDVYYTYAKTGRLQAARNGSVTGTVISAWQYDNVGNVTVRTTGAEIETNTYDYAYRISKTVKTDSDDTITTTNTTFDKDGNTQTTTTGGSTFTYNYDQNTGLQTSITGSGADISTSSSSSIYDVNRRVVSITRGDGDDDSSVANKTFVYDNEGKIVSRSFDDAVTYYLYVNGNAVGEYTDASTPTLNAGNYSVLQTLSTGFADDDTALPASSITQYTVLGGETLRSLAGQYYGSPDLWYVIADANGLSGQEVLSAGSRLIIPNSASNAYQTAETFALYQEGDIVGSKLPNLAAAPVEEDECAKIGAIILVVVVAIAAIALTVVTVGAAAPAAAAALGFAAGGAAAIATGVVVGAVVGAAIAFAASAATQGILVGFGLQEEFDWNAVAADVVAGAFGGAAAGLGAAVSAARTITTTVKVVNVVGQIALETAGEAASQVILNDGKIDSPWLVVAAGAGGALGSIGDIAGRSAKAGSKLGLEAGEKAIVASTGLALGTRNSVEKGISIVDDIADVARKAKKGNLGVFADVFKYQVAEITGTTFKQTVAKGGKKLADDAVVDGLESGKKLVREFKKLKNGLKRVDYQTVDQLSAAGTSVTKRLGKAGDAVNTAVRGGTVFKGASTKTVKVFENGRAVFKQVARQSTSGTSLIVGGTKLEKLTTVGKAAIAGLTSASTAAKNGFSAVANAAGSAVESARNTLSALVASKPIRASTGLASGTRDGITAGLSTIDDIAAVAKRAGKGKFGVYLEVLKYRASLIAGSSFSQTVAKDFMGIAENLGDGKKLVRTFTKLKDGTSLIDFQTVDRLSSAGTSLKARAAKNWTSAKDALNTVINGKTLIKGANTKTIKVFENGVPVFKQIARQSVAGTSLLAGGTKLEKLKILVAPAIAGFNSAVSAAAKGIKRVPGLIQENITGAKAIKKLVTVGNLGVSVAAAYEEERVKANNPEFRSGSLFQGSSAGRKGFDPLIAGNISKLSFLKAFAGSLQKIIGGESRGLLSAGATSFDDFFTAKRLSFEDTFNSQVARVEQLFSPSESDTTLGFGDINARNTYAERHNRQHKFLTLQWFDVAANTTSGIFSPFALDRVADLKTLQNSNRMITGEVAGFDQIAIVAQAGSVVGGVGGNAAASPSQVT